MKDASPVVKTHHPFGDPHATQWNQRDELMRELMMRQTQERMEPPSYTRDPLAPVSGEIAVPVRHTWTWIAATLLVVALAACLVVALL
jgi:hypothetical protein